MPSPSEFEHRLRGAALRVTRPRVAVLSAVHDHPHADTDSIIGVVRDNLGEVWARCPECLATTETATNGSMHPNSHQQQTAR